MARSRAQRRRNYPKGWIVNRPNTDTNKEAGTVSTGDYGRGDSAALFVANKSLVGGNSLSNKESVEGVIKKALAQKVLTSRTNRVSAAAMGVHSKLLVVWEEKTLRRIRHLERGDGRL